MKRLLIIISIFICLINILLWPVNKYEWMLVDDPQMTLPVDSNTTIYSVLAIAPTFLLALYSVFSKSNKDRKTLILICIILLAVWLYKYGYAIIKIYN